MREYRFSLTRIFPNKDKIVDSEHQSAIFAKKLHCRCSTGLSNLAICLDKRYTELQYFHVVCSCFKQTKRFHHLL